MTFEQTHWVASDGTTTSMRLMETHEPEGIVVIFHGMMEHGARYQEFAEFLNAHHFHTVIPDLRCFGEQASNRKSLGHLKADEGFDTLMRDAEELISDIKERYPALPLIVLGHSFGSLIARRLGQTLGHELAGIIVTGPLSSAGLLGKLSLATLRSTIERGSDTLPAKAFSRFVFGRYNLPFFPAASPNAWLSSDPQSVLRYDSDQLCGQTVSLGFFYELLRGTALVNSLANIYRHPRDLPILLLAGVDDQVAFDGQGIKKLFDAYNRVRVETVQLSLYENMRHELFQEKDRMRVFAEIAGWLHKQVKFEGHSLREET
ncbi:alpha/beta fold hydrolase [Exiguobacterium flavidum]|uniref:alpha/beta fold hydrolase n=1 Tax=Exiguobacterium flavidum TaxID=2184695 RepID=UPI000DF72912|nr:alpha/beta fold hydrolase [Exiguobacterium flavidum]